MKDAWAVNMGARDSGRESGREGVGLESGLGVEDVHKRKRGMHY